MAIESLRDVARAGVSAFSAGGGSFTESGTAPGSPSYGDRWLDTTTGIQYTWVDPGVWVDLSEPSPADVADAIHSATSKTTPVDADELGITDSADSWSLKYLTWANLKATLLAYFKGQFREKLTAARTYYVRTDGSDSNDGLANTSGGAFLTIQKAVDVASSLDNGGFDVTLSIGAGTFTSRVFFKSFVGGGLVKLVGAGVASTTIDPASSDGVGVVQGFGVTGIYQIEEVKIQYTGTGKAQALLYAYGGSTIYFGNIAFGAGSAWHVGAQFHGYCEALANYSITGGADSHMAAFTSGAININGKTVTITGTPAFATTFARAEFTSTIYAYGNTYSGSATGKRYQVSAGGGIRVIGAGTTYFPGNVSGTETAPGWYV